MKGKSCSACMRMVAIRLNMFSGQFWRNSYASGRIIRQLRWQRCLKARVMFAIRVYRKCETMDQRSQIWEEAKRLFAGRTVPVTTGLVTTWFYDGDDLPVRVSRIED